MALWSRRAVPAPIVLPVAPIQTLNEHPFRGWTESLFVSGLIRDEDRLSDALNRREPVRIDGPSIMPIGAATQSRMNPPEMTLDPFDFELVLGMKQRNARPGDPSARRIHKVRYPVEIMAGAFQIFGTLHIFPGNAPEFVAQYSGALFFPITDPTIRRDGRVITDPTVEVALINRYSIQKITQLDIVH